MTAGPGTPLGRTLRRAARLPDHEGAADGRLLGRFLTDRDEPAFAELVRRHGPMVLGVCRRVAGNHADADDAFQAAFLVLIRRASGLLDRPTVGDFLYGVAYRTALKARVTAVKRRLKEAKAARPEAAPAAADEPDGLPDLDRELARLPEKYRTAVVLCDLEERPRKDVAAALGIPEGTLSSRLAVGRQLLADRLRRHGLAVPAAGLTATVSPALANSTLDAAAVAAGHAAGVVPVAVTKLVTEVTRTMLVTKLGLGAAVLAVGLAAGAAGLVAADPPAKADGKAPAEKAAEPVTVKRLIDAERKATKDLTGTWELKTRTIDGVELKPGGKARINGQEVSLPLKYQRWTFGDRTVRVEYEWAEGDRQAGEKHESEHTVTVNPTADPPQINIYSKGTLLLGLYRLDGDTLEFATHGISELERPKGFDHTAKRIADLPLIVDTYKWVRADDPKPKAAADDRPAWRKEFDRAYALKDGEVLKRVAPPYPGSRVEFWKDLHPGNPRTAAECERYFTAYRFKDGRVEGGPVQTPVQPEDGVTLSDLLGLLDFPAQTVEGDVELLAARVTGDFVLRAGADPAKVAAALGWVLRDLGVKAKLAVRDEPREVVVLKGEWASKPLDGKPKDHVELYSRRLFERPESTGGGGTGTFAEFAGRLQGFINQRVVSEVKGPPAKVGWRDNIRGRMEFDPATGKDTYAEDTDGGPVLVNVAQQTGLTFAVEKRTVPVLFVERVRE